MNKSSWVTMRRRVGFTLVEVSIVLGIVGLMTGAVWTVAKNLAFTTQLNQASDDVNNIVVNARALFAGQNSSYAGISAGQTLSIAPTATDFCTATTKAISQKVFPYDMSKNGGFPNNPWSSATSCSATAGSVLVGLACSSKTVTNPVTGVITISCDSTGYVQLVIRYLGLPIAACSNMVMQNSVSGPGVGLSKIIVTPTGGTATASAHLPATSADAALCTGATNTVDWYYNLGGGGG